MTRMFPSFLVTLQKWQCCPCNTNKQVLAVFRVFKKKYLKIEHCSIDSYVHMFTVPNLQASQSEWGSELLGKLYGSKFVSVQGERSCVKCGHKAPKWALSFVPLSFCSPLNPERVWMFVHTPRPGWIEISCSFMGKV